MEIQEKVEIFYTVGVILKIIIEEHLHIKFLNFLMVSFALFYGWPNWIQTVLSLTTLVAASTFVYFKTSAQKARPTVRLIPAREVRRA